LPGGPVLRRRAVRATVKRLHAAGLSWPLPEGFGDAELEALLHANAGKKPGHRRCPEPDWAAMHRELKRRHATLSILWDEHIEQYPDGFRYSRFRELCRAWEGKLPVTSCECTPLA
jgi:transposase